MTDRQKHCARLVELMRDNDDAIPYLVGYLTYHLDEELLEKAVQAYLKHDEDLGLIRNAQADAE